MSELATMKNKLNGAAKSLVDAQEKLMVTKGYDANAIEAKLSNEVKQIMTNANPENTATDSEGGALVPTAVMLDDIMSKAASGRYGFLNGLASGRLPDGDNKNVEKAVVGDTKFGRATSEYVSGALTVGGTPSMINDFSRVSFNMRPVFHSVGVSDELETFGAASALAMAQAQSAEVYLQTIADIVLNADSLVAATGNINSDDQDPTTTFADGALDRRVSFNDGLRKQPINGVDGVDKLDVGTFETNDIFTLAGLMRFDSNPSDRIIIMDNGTYHQAMQQDDFKDLSKNGAGSTITTGAITNIAGMDLFVTDLMRTTEADGKLSGATPAGNTQGQFVIAERNVIQHMIWASVVEKVDHNVEQGYLYQHRRNFGFANVNKVAGVTKPSIVVGYNVTIS